MKTKLTLTIEKKVIDRAKRYSQKKGRSLSDIVEKHLHDIVSNDKKRKPESSDDHEPSEAFKFLDGCLKGAFPNDFDWKEERAKGILEKYWRK